MRALLYIRARWLAARDTAAGLRSGFALFPGKRQCRKALGMHHLAFQRSIDMQVTLGDVGFVTHISAPSGRQAQSLLTGRCSPGSFITTR